MGIIRFKDLRKTEDGCRSASSDGGHHARPMCGSVRPSDLAQSPPAGTHTHWACSYWLLRAVSKHFSGTCSSVVWKLSGSSLPSIDTSPRWGDMVLQGPPLAPPFSILTAERLVSHRRPLCTPVFTLSCFQGLRCGEGGSRCRRSCVACRGAHRVLAVECTHQSLRPLKPHLVCRMCACKCQHLS